MDNADIKECPLCRTKMSAKALFCASCKSFTNQPSPEALKKKFFAQRAKAKERSGSGPVIKKNSAHSAGLSSYSEGEKSSYPGTTGAAPSPSPGLSGGDSMVIKASDLQAIVREVNSQIQHSLASSTNPRERELEREEFNRVIRAFAEKYSERTISNVSRGAMEREYEIEEKKLAAEFSSFYWNRLEPAARNLLISSRLIYNSLMAARGETDYSGSCLLSLRSLEVVMFKRFYTDFIAYMNEHYPGRENMALWPTALLNKYDKKKPTKKFSLIGVSFVLCHKHSAGNSARLNENNLARLLEYARARLLAKDPGDKKIEKMMSELAGHIEKICKDPRNPAENAGELKVISASDCLTFNGYVEKLIKLTLQYFTVAG